MNNCSNEARRFGARETFADVHPPPLPPLASQHPGWAPLARLSYGAYLIHPIVVQMFVLTGTEKIRFDQASFVSYYIASCVVTFAATMAVSLVIESPINVLTRRLIKGKKLGKDTVRASVSARTSDRPRPPATAHHPSATANH